jgi:hypothetical protein
MTAGPELEFIRLLGADIEAVTRRLNAALLKDRVFSIVRIEDSEDRTDSDPHPVKSWQATVLSVSIKTLDIRDEDHRDTIYFFAIETTVGTFRVFAHDGHYCARPGIVHFQDTGIMIGEATDLDGGGHFTLTAMVA